MGEMRNDFFSYNDGYFVVVKSDTLLRLGVNDFPQHSTKYMLNVYPNPTLNKTTISFQLINHEIEKIRVSLYDIFGRKIYDIYEGELRNGAYSYQLNTSALFSGLYFINLVVGSKSILKKIINIHN